MSQEQPSPPSADSSLDGSDQFAVRQSKLDHLRESGNDPYRSNWDQSHTSSEALDLLPEDLEEGPEVSVAGRIVAFRLMGKASFLKIIDRDGKIQSYVRRDEIGDDEYAAFKSWILVTSLEFEALFSERGRVRLRFEPKSTG